MLFAFHVNKESTVNTIKVVNSVDIKHLEVLSILKTTLMTRNAQRDKKQWTKTFLMFIKQHAVIVKVYFNNADVIFIASRFVYGFPSR